MQGSSPLQGAYNRRAMEANIGKFYVFQFFLNFQLWWPIWVIYLTETRGLSLAQVTLIDVPFWLCIIVLQIPAAAIADRWGRKPTLAAGAFALSVAVTLFGLAPSFPLLLTSYLIWGVAMVLVTGPDSAFLYDSLRALGREGEYQKLYGRAWGVIAFGGLAGTLAGAPIAAATSLPFPIIVSGVIALGAVLTALTFHEPLTELRAEAAHSYRAVIRDALGLVARQREVRYAVLFFGVMTVGSIAPIFFFQPFLVEHGVDLDVVGFWQTPARIAGILGAVLAYRWAAALGERRLFTLMPAVTVASFLVLATVDSLWAMAAFPMLNLIAIATRPTVTDYLNRRVPTGQRATVISLTNLVYSLVLVPTAPLLGALADRASLSAPFLAGAVIVGVGAIVVLPLWFRLPEPQPAPALAEASPAEAAMPRLD